MKKAVIHERVSGVRLRGTVPRPYREEIAKGTDPNGIYTVTLCPHTERDAGSSPTLTKAFRQLRQAAPDGIIIVGTVFTVEAQAFAKNTRRAYYPYVNLTGRTSQRASGN